MNRILRKSESISLAGCSHRLLSKLIFYHTFVMLLCFFFCCFGWLLLLLLVSNCDFDKLKNPKPTLQTNSLKKRFLFSNSSRSILFSYCSIQMLAFSTVSYFLRKYFAYRKFVYFQPSIKRLSKFISSFHMHVIDFCYFSFFITTFIVLNHFL